MHQAEVTHATSVTFYWLQPWPDFIGREKRRTVSEERRAKAGMGEHWVSLPKILSL